jgi:hypothetical protein
VRNGIKCARLRFSREPDESVAGADAGKFAQELIELQRWSVSRAQTQRSNAPVHSGNIALQSVITNETMLASNFARTFASIPVEKVERGDLATRASQVVPPPETTQWRCG